MCREYLLESDNSVRSWCITVSCRCHRRRRRRCAFFSAAMIIPFAFVTDVICDLLTRSSVFFFSNGLVFFARALHIISNQMLSHDLHFDLPVNLRYHLRRYCGFFSICVIFSLRFSSMHRSIRMSFFFLFATWTRRTSCVACLENGFWVHFSRTQCLVQSNAWPYLASAYGSIINWMCNILTWIFFIHLKPMNKVNTIKWQNYAVKKTIQREFLSKSLILICIPWKWF